MVGWNYDARGNLLSGGGETFTYDLLGRMTSRNGTILTSNGDGVLVQSQTNGITTTYVHDLSRALPQILTITEGTNTRNAIYSDERLGEWTADGLLWHVADARGSLVMTLAAASGTRATTSYDPWGQPTGPKLSPFGYTGELQAADGIQRASEGRPVNQALADAHQARQADLFIQPDGRYVVRGPKSREHIFTPEGQVLTSIHSRHHQAHLNLVRNNSRRPATEAEYYQFKELIR